MRGPVESRARSASSSATFAAARAGAAQILGLRIVAMLESLAPARIGFARENELLEAGWPAKSIERLPADRATCRRATPPRDARADGIARPAPRASRYAFGMRRRSHISSTSATPRCSCATCRGHSLARRRRPCPDRASVQRSARPDRRSDRAACSSAINVCTPVSISGCHCSGWGTPKSAATSGKIDRERVCFTQHFEKVSAASAFEGALRLLPDALGTSASSSPRAAISRINAIVSGAMRKPSGAKRAAKRATRSTRTGSSTNAGETCRSQRSRRSRWPLNGSTSCPVGFPRDCVDRQVATLEILFERDVGRERGVEAAIARTGLAFGARERVFLARLGMQEDREVLADRAVALRDQFLRPRADDHPVALATGSPRSSSRTAPPTR